MVAHVKTAQPVPATPATHIRVKEVNGAMEVRKVWVRAWQCHLLAVQPWALSLRVLFCKWEKLTTVESS